jgi:tetratricopeptide (TPR) repeat protein
VKIQSTPSGRFLLAFIFFPFLIQAQIGSSKIDSLEALLPSTTGIVKFQVLAGLFNETKQTNFEAALSYARQANSVAETMGDSVLIVEGGRMMAYSLDDLGKRDEAIIILNKVIGIAFRNQLNFPLLKIKVVNLLNNAAIAYMYVGQYDSALSYNFKSLEIREQAGDKRAVAIAKHNIGIIYFKLENYKNALSFYKQALELMQDLKDKDSLFKLLTNIGLCYNEIGEIENAIKFLNDGLNTCGNNCSDTELAIAFYGLGVANRKVGETNKAIDFFKKALAIANRNNDFQQSLYNLIDLGQLEFKSGRFSESLKYLIEAEKFISKTSNIESELSLYWQLFKTYKGLNDPTNGLIFLERYAILKDSVFSKEQLTSVTKIQSDFDERINLQIIKEKEKSLVLQNEIIERQHLQTILIAIISGLFLFIIILLYSNYRKKVKFEVILEARVKSRTAELEISRFTLEQQNYEQLTIIQKTVMENKSLLATLHGSFNLATRELKDPIAVNYFLSIRKMVGQLEESFKTLHHNLAQTDKSPQK